MYRKPSLVRYRGWGMGCRLGSCRIVGENGCWRVRGMIEISVRVRMLINSKFQMLLVRNELLKFLNIISKLL